MYPSCVRWGPASLAQQQQLVQAHWHQKQAYRFMTRHAQHVQPPARQIATSEWHVPVQLPTTQFVRLAGKSSFSCVLFFAKNVTLSKMMQKQTRRLSSWRVHQQSLHRINAQRHNGMQALHLSCGTVCSQQHLHRKNHIQHFDLHSLHGCRKLPLAWVLPFWQVL
jgi:hypothetical protein